MYKQFPLAYTVPDGVSATIYTGQGQRLGKNAIYNLINSGELKARKMGRRTIVLHTNLQNYLNNLPDYLAAEKTRYPTSYTKEVG